MWKIILAFIVFAGLALFILSKGGDIDMSGEKHGTEAHGSDAPAAAPGASGAAPAAASAASAASN